MKWRKKERKKENKIERVKRKGENKKEKKIEWIIQWVWSEFIRPSNYKEAYSILIVDAVNGIDTTLDD